MLSPGQVINNRYRIVRLLGQGGFGAVYKAWDLTFQTSCAIKENHETSPEAQRQFLLEARILFSLRHPNLPQVKDYFVIQDALKASGFAYLVMDFIEGEDLEQKLHTKGGPLEEREVLAWISQICDALIYLHSQNPPVIHRDVKPANIRIMPDGRAVLVDFGIAKVYDPMLRTTAGARAITPGYSPLEQYGGGGRTDARTDILAPTPTPGLETSITDDRGVQMALIPAGDFQMGISADVAYRECAKHRKDNCSADWFTADEPAHLVFLDEYYMDIYEVTNAQYLQCVQNGACTEPSQECVQFTSLFNIPTYDDATNADYPMVCADWHQAQTYCEWRGGSLPTEAQWEKAARGTDGRMYPWGDNFNPDWVNSCDVNCPNPTDKTYDDGYAHSAPVGSYPNGASPYGIFDMAGNVWEWVLDWYSDTYYQSSPSENPAGPTLGDTRVVRGGGYLDYDITLAAPGRMWDDKGCADCGIAIGFRCVRKP